MKRLTVLIVFLAIVGIAFYFTSCKKDPVYSCDKELNEYAATTMSANQGISRDSLAQLGIDTQFAIFNSLSSSNKMRIFNEKIGRLLMDNTISQADKNHLQVLREHITSGFYEFENESDPFVDAWKIQAVNDLNWDGTKMYLYVETWLLISEIPQFTTNNPIFEGGNGLNCKCNSRFACGLGLFSCKTSGCTETRTGCGIYGSNPCKGVCDY